VEWFHQKDYSLHAKVGDSGSIKCQQFVGGATPPGSGGQQRGGCMLAVLVSSYADTLQAYCHWWNGFTRKTTHCMQRWGPQEA